MCFFNVFSHHHVSVPDTPHDTGRAFSVQDGKDYPLLKLYSVERDPTESLRSVVLENGKHVAGALKYSNYVRTKTCCLNRKTHMIFLSTSDKLLRFFDELFTGRLIKQNRNASTKKHRNEQRKQGRKERSKKGSKKGMKEGRL